MIQKIYAVRDLKAQAFLQPFFSVQNGSAIRAFGDAIKEETSPFCKHPEDYILYEIGQLDDVTGEITPVWPVNHLIAATDFKNSAVPVTKNGAEKVAL